MTLEVWNNGETREVSVTLQVVAQPSDQGGG